MPRRLNGTAHGAAGALAILHSGLCSRCSSQAAGEQPPLAQRPASEHL